MRPNILYLGLRASSFTAKISQGWVSIQLKKNWDQGDEIDGIEEKEQECDDDTDSDDPDYIPNGIVETGESEEDDKEHEEKPKKTGTLFQYFMSKRL